jgi:hypothetical protein
MHLFGIKNHVSLGDVFAALAPPDTAKPHLQLQLIMAKQCHFQQEGKRNPQA